jgi:egghead protein (zeste-white 4 protein)
MRIETTDNRTVIAPSIPQWRWALVAYYSLLAAVTLMGIVYGYLFSEIFMPGNQPLWVETVMKLLKLFWLVPLPYAAVNFYAFIRFPIFLPPELPSLLHTSNARIFVRIVTRGHNPRLVAASVQDACREFGAVLKPTAWCIEVVSDNPLQLDTSFDNQVQVILVPENYQTANRSQYKARALNYALENSTAADNDWIIHLDEETRFTRETIRQISSFIRRQEESVLRGQQYPAIGQGAILYGTGKVVNWLTTLADSIRVADDYGRFRLQYTQGKAWFGMHGSFIAVQNAVEKLVGLDHGPVSSITEDTYFALKAQEFGVPFAFIHAQMYEQSPFTVKDFIKQRRRWFGGIWLCVLKSDTRWKERAVLGLFMLMWSFSWMCPVMVIVNFIFPTGTPVWLGILAGLAFIYTVLMYVLGFMITFRPAQIGRRRYALLLGAQILGVPLFSVMESVAILYGLILPPKGFYIVQKEAHH